MTTVSVENLTGLQVALGDGQRAATEFLAAARRLAAKVFAFDGLLVKAADCLSVLTSSPMLVIGPLKLLGLR